MKYIFCLLDKNTLIWKIWLSSDIFLYWNFYYLYNFQFFNNFFNYLLIFVTVTQAVYTLHSK